MKVYAVIEDWGYEPYEVLRAIFSTEEKAQEWRSRQARVSAMDIQEFALDEEA